MKTHLLQYETTINKPLREVFDFFSKAENLNVLTPDELHFKILTSLPVVLKQGTLIDYRLSLNGIPFKWKTKITAWQPPYEFEDTQLRGPYLKWVHRHTFKEVNNKTVMNDHLEYAVPGWIFEPLITKWFVKEKVEQIFSFREKRLKELFK